MESLKSQGFFGSGEVKNAEIGLGAGGQVSEQIQSEENQKLNEYFGGIQIRSAFKEWRSVIEALGRGEQIVILRRGGIIEYEGDFYPREKFFFLFPTLTHEKPELLKKTYEYNGRITEDEIEVRYWAEVRLARKIEDEDKLKQLDPYHIWKEEVVLERFRRWGKKEVWALAVRVFKLKKPFYIKMRADYGGCKSWVDIVEEDFAGVELDSVPVLSDEDFIRRFEEIRRILE
jgi:hypothetical protein